MPDFETVSKPSLDADTSYFAGCRAGKDARPFSSVSAEAQFEWTDPAQCRISKLFRSPLWTRTPRISRAVERGRTPAPSRLFRPKHNLNGLTRLNAGFRNCFEALFGRGHLVFRGL